MSPGIQRGEILGTVVRDVGWYSRVRRAVDAGQLTAKPVRVPAGDAERLLKGVIRFVADIPAGANLALVWEQGASELSVDAGSISLTCGTGLVTIGVTVDCDQLAEPVVATVPIAVGRVDSPAGLVMSTFQRVQAPDLVADLWSEAITAFAWEALLELARRLCADMGRDAAGKALIPGGIAAAPDVLIIQPMARHDLSAIGG